MKKASTIYCDRSRIGKHVVPLLGPLSAAAVTHDDIEDFMHKAAARGGKGTATRTTNLLSAIFSYAISKGVRPDNPCKGIKRFAEGKRDRRFSDDEYKRLGIALRKAQDEQIWPGAVDAVRFIALTGWRAGEAVALRWSDIDLDRRTALLSDTKTGRSMRPLSQAACDVLGGIPRTKDVVFVPPPRSSDGQWFKTRVKRNIFPLGVCLAISECTCSGTRSPAWRPTSAIPSRRSPRCSVRRGAASRPGTSILRTQRCSPPLTLSLARLRT
jgi:integrase